MVKDSVYGLNHQVNPADLVQFKVKHEIWQVQNTRHGHKCRSISHTTSEISGNLKLLFSLLFCLFMSIFLPWVKQQDLSVIILFEKVLHSEPQHDL